ncbi:MAG TPA: PIG-L family deacetylase [Planctomycetota bacterium]|nr:PIG-L family deacetylase [Planctomycetota bacterium]
MDFVTRRQMLEGSIGLAAAASLQDPPPPPRRLKVAFVGAHPDDVETAAGGTVARYADAGHDVVILNLTRGEAGMRGKSHEEAGTIRSSEARKACEILKARPRFLGQVDGSTEVNPARYDEFRQSLMEEKPDLVFTWWPINSHRDHRAVISMVHDAWLKTRKPFTLLYFENSDTQLFVPTHFVDITDLEPRKRAACFSHTWYRDRADLNLYAGVELCLRARGLQAGCTYAEAFVAHSMNRGVDLGLGKARR